ncbi:ribonuclease H-like domain-containing protein [Entophlyctis helioformis]|nr:ribonuclease H-like domain-containing protein [Entophlyctis helioformis]
MGGRARVPQPDDLADALDTLALDDAPGTEGTATATPHLDALRRELAEMGITDVKGNKADLKKRLDKAKKRQKAQEDRIAKEAAAAAAAAVQAAKPQPYDIYLVCDIEGTCTDDSSFDYANEIIEFPVIAVDAATLEELGTFHRFVRPLINPTLTDFCTRLTGITQDMVDAADPFPTVFADFQTWLSTLTATDAGADPRSAIFVTDGPWDLRDFVEKELVYCGIERPAFMKKVVDIRKCYAEMYKTKANLAGMLEGLDMEFEGRQHSGLDDTTNIVRIFRRLVADGCRMASNTSVHKKASGGAWKTQRKKVAPPALE